MRNELPLMKMINAMEERAVYSKPPSSLPFLVQELHWPGVG